MTRLPACLCAVLLTGLALHGAAAQPVSGPYIAGSLGANWKAPQGFTLPAGCIGTPCPPAAGTQGPAAEAPSRPAYGNLGAETRAGTGVGGTGSAGWGFGNGLRLEVEGSGRGGR